MNKQPSKKPKSTVIFHPHEKKELKKWLDKFLKKHRKALERLAKS